MQVNRNTVLFVAAMSFAFALPQPSLAYVNCNGRPCTVGPIKLPHCVGGVPPGCVCEYSPRTGTWGKACPHKVGGNRLMN